MKVRGPLVNSYWSAVLLVICALVPFLALSSALFPLIPIIGPDVHLSTQALALTLGLSNAAYALGTVLSVQLAVHYPQRRLLVIYTVIFTLGSLMSATAFTPGLFVAGHVIQGLFTSMMLIAAAPALVLGWPSVAAADHRDGHEPRDLRGGRGGTVDRRPPGQRRRLAAAVLDRLRRRRPRLVLSLLTFEDTPAQDPEAPRDWLAIVLAGTGCAAAFFGASELQTHRMLDLIVFLPLLTGVGLLLVLILHQVFARNPLMPMAQLLSTFPVAAVTIAIAAGAGSVALIELVQAALAAHQSPAHIGVLFLPEVGGAVFTAFLFGSLIRTRYVPLLAWTGLLDIAGGAAVLTGVAADRTHSCSSVRDSSASGLAPRWRPRCSAPASRCVPVSCLACSRCSSCSAARPRSRPVRSSCTWR